MLPQWGKPTLAKINCHSGKQREAGGEAKTLFSHLRVVLLWCNFHCRLSAALRRESSLFISVNYLLCKYTWLPLLTFWESLRLFSQLRTIFEADAVLATLLIPHWKTCHNSNLQHKQTQDCMEKRCLKTTIMDCQRLKTKAIFYTKAKKTPLGEIFCQKKNKSDKQWNQGVPNETKDRREARGKREENRVIFHADLCSVQEKWDTLLPYVHLLQLNTHIRKGLLKRGNNEKDRDRELWVVCLLHLAGSVLSAGTKRSPLPTLIPSGLVGKWQKSMLQEAGLYVKDAWIWRRRTNPLRQGY